MTITRADLVDDEGENRAVRGFLAQYGVPGLTIGQMKQWMRVFGYAFWPEWAALASADGHHLTKAGAQLWLRYLFDLEHLSDSQLQSLQRARP